MNYHRTLTKKSTRYLVTVAGSLILHFSLITSGEAAVEGIACTPEPTDMVIKYGDLINCDIDVVGDNDVFRFSGAAGEVIKVLVDGLAGNGYPVTRVYAPDGTLVPSDGRRNHTLSQTGTHTILVGEIQGAFTVQYGPIGGTVR